MKHYYMIIVAMEHLKKKNMIFIKNAKYIKK